MDVAYSGINFVKIFFISVGKAGYTTLSYSGISFKHIVLGYYGSLWDFRPPATIYLAVFRAAFWILSMGFNWGITTLRLIKSEYSSVDLKNFVGEEINTSHLITNELTLDVTSIPEEERSNIRLELLADFLREINFADSNSVYYMSPASRQEGSAQYSEEELRDSLRKFITRVNNREAFLGTPSLIDTPRLMGFYQQIEDALRLAIYEVHSKIKAFEQDNGLTNQTPQQKEVIIGQMLGSTRNIYRNLLEDRSRLAVDIAIAGKHCGGRYMGDSMTCYFNICGNGSDADETLKDSLVSLLGQERRTIANEQIQTHLGNDTHAYANYMQTMGTLLALPGTANIIEPLASPLNKNIYLRYFFNTYTTSRIIQTVQNKIKTSQPLREKITDWLKSQVGDWKQQDYVQRAAEITQEINRIKTLNILSNQSDSYLNFTFLQQLLTYLRDQSIELPTMENGAEDFLQDLFALEQSKTFLSMRIPGDTPQITIQKIQMKQKIIQAFSEPSITSALTSYIQTNSENEIRQTLLDMDKIEQIQGLIIRNQITVDDDGEEEVQPIGLNLNEAVIQRILRDQVDVLEVVNNKIDQTREIEFLDALQLEGIVENGLSAKLLEWMLVSQEILLPQEVI